MHDKTKNLLGYDEHGRLIDAGASVTRFIAPAYLDNALEIFHLYKTNNMDDIGIVQTSWNEVGKYFTHEKQIISYPYEWTAEMYKDAVLFHLKLFLSLDKFDLTLKDALPSNVLFDSTHPVFVDFLSIIKTINIDNEKWLVDGSTFNDKRFAVVEKMLIPFLLVPLLAMGNKNYPLARQMLSDKACNMGNGQPELREAFHKKTHSVRDCLKSPVSIVGNFFKKQQINKNVRKIIDSFQNGIDFKSYISNLYELAKNTEVTPLSGAYGDYYSKKQESFNFSSQEGWGSKQKSVFTALKQEAPETVVDIGANTGWFSFLAESLGAKVIALEIEEDCANAIYTLAKKGDHHILPLVVSFDDLSKSYYGQEPTGVEYLGRDFKNNPLFLAPVERFQVDFVMCLGLIHHLVLGMGHEVSYVLKVLSQMAQKSLLIEFVSLDDPLVKGEPSFFKNVGRFNKDNYNLELVIMEGQKYFNTVEILDSHPDTRKLILFKKI